jgi:hypothetical protein
VCRSADRTGGILRYRLYDLDRIISRTLAHGLLTVLLGGGYALVVLGLGQLLGRRSSLAVAGATLVVAAVFQPARRRVQAAVDRLPCPSRPTSSSHWVELEDTSALGRFNRMVEIDTVDDANEPDTERHGSRVRTEDVAKEADSLCRVQLGRAHFLFPAAHRDRRATGRAQIAHPLDLAPGSPDPTPAAYLDDRQRRGARQAALPAANGDEPIGT